MTVHSILMSYGEIRKRYNRLVLPKNREVYKNDMQKFSDIINSYPYRKDPLFGALDYTRNPDDFYDTSIVFSRDCDDFARQWSLWGLFNGYDAYEILVTNRESPFKSAHVITVLEKDAKFYLMNYEHYGQFDTIDDAINYMKQFPSYWNGIEYYIYIHFNKELICQMK